MQTQSNEIRHRIFHQFFPPPKFLEMPAIGFDIGDTAIFALELIRHEKGFAVGRHESMELPDKIISGGYVNNRDAVIAELKKIKHSLKLDFVNASISEEKAYLFNTRIPKVKNKEIRQVIEFKLEENVPLSANDAVFDFTVLGEIPSKEELNVSVTVLPRKVVDTYTGILKEAGLSPLSFEIQAQAVSRSVVAYGDRGNYLIVNLGKKKTGLYIVSSEVVHFTSTVAFGSSDITEAISKHLSISKEEAELLKRDNSSFKDGKNMEALLSLSDIVSVLKEEINKLFVYWDTHMEPVGINKKIRKIILCGQDAATTGFADYLSLVLQSHVETANVWKNAFVLDDYIPPLNFRESLDYAAAIGLSLPKGE